jgi:CDP-6-deoxy-D-xylo-4-hexulose-3-dehydrase
MRQLVEKFLADAMIENGGQFPFMANKSRFDPSKDTVYYSGPFWDQQEIAEAIHSLVKGKWLSSGEKVARFEKKFGEQFNFAHNVMVNSGSSANLVMIAALKKRFGWLDGDEIIVSACGFPTTIAPVAQNNLVPLFVDITMDDLNWDLDQVESSIGPRTRAVFMSPVLGNPGDMDRLVAICQLHNIKLIADNCDSLGSRWQGQYITDHAVAASCSFYPAHHICTMEGGMVSSNDPEIVKLARSMAWWGRDCHCVGSQNLISCGMCGERFKQWLPTHDGIVDHKYVFANMGYNLKPLDLQGGIGLIQLTKWDTIHKLRRTNKTKIGNMLERIPGVRIVAEHSSAETSWFGVPVVCESADLKTKLVTHLENNRIQTRNYFAGNILKHPGYCDLGDHALFPNSNSVLSTVFFLGCSPTINEKMLERIKDVINAFVENSNV